MHETPWLNKTEIENAIELLDAGIDADDAMAVYDRWLSLKEVVRELDAKLTSTMIELIRAQPDKQIFVGTKKYYVGERKQVVCRDKGEAVQMILELLGPEGLKQCLRTQPFKPATTKVELEKAESGDDFDRLFEMRVVESVGEAKPNERLIVRDNRYQT